MIPRKFPILLGFAVLGVCLLSPGLRGATATMPVSELRPGMVGIGHTVFDGTHVEEFKAHMNSAGPADNDLIRHADAFCKRYKACGPEKS